VIHATITRVWRDYSRRWLHRLQPGRPLAGHDQRRWHAKLMGVKLFAALNLSPPVSGS
jgi:hypothetical protein